MHSFAQRARTPFALPFHRDNNINLKQSKPSPFCALLGETFASARLSTLQNIPAHKNVICRVEKNSQRTRKGQVSSAPRFSSFDIHTQQYYFRCLFYIFLRPPFTLAAAKLVNRKKCNIPLSFSICVTAKVPRNAFSPYLGKQNMISERWKNSKLIPLNVGVLIKNSANRSIRISCLALSSLHRPWA
jgi:hypothetical protein